MVNRFSILLVNPACKDLRITDDDARVIPIGLYYMAALLLNKGFNVTLLNLAQGDQNPLHCFSDHIDSRFYHLIGFSITNPNRINAMACANLLKEKHKDSQIVFGGPAATFLSDHLFEACPAIDFIIPGEGEQVLFNLARHMQTHPQEGYDSINGLVFKKKHQLVRTPPQKQIENLDTLPHPSDYFSFSHLSMSRGCPGRCTFCGSPQFWPNRHIRFHSPQWMAKEIHQLFKKGTTHFYLSDDTFTMDKDRVIELCHLLSGLDLPITWNAISRVDYVDADLLCAMRKAGCIQISYGVESGSSIIRKKLGKPVEQDQIIQAFEQTLSHGILPRAYFIYGSPAETRQTIQASIELLHRIKPLSAIFYMLVIFPGTYLYSQAKKKGLLDDTIWYEPIEDLPWFELDSKLDLTSVKAFGDRLRHAFYTSVSQFARDIQLIDSHDLYPYHADFLSRLAMTFSHGEYAGHPQVRHPEKTARHLYEQALSYTPDARAFLGLGMLLQKKKDFNGAVKTLTNGLTYFKDHKDLNICMGLCLMNMKAFASALPFFEPFQSDKNAAHYMRICRQQLTVSKTDRKTE
jgi:anaerobic magnesium-protoporphyrin IX monomethyl ester cyclase